MTATQRVMPPLVLASCVLLTATAAVLAASNSPTDKTVSYRWVDEQGVVHYGDHIPPQYATQDRAVLNSQGVEVKHLEAQRSPEEIDAAAHERAAQMKQKQHDAFLVTTYTSVKDIESLRDARLEQLQAQRAADEQYLETLRVRLGMLQVRALNFTPYNAQATHRLPDDLAENLVRTVNEMRLQSAAITARREQESALREQFQTDIDRYRELHTIHSQ